MPATQRERFPSENHRENAVVVVDRNLNRREHMATKKAVKKPAKKAPAKKTPAKKAPAKKVPAKKAAPKKAAKKTARKPNAAFMKPLTPQGPLAAIIGSVPMPRTEVTSKMWAYIKKNNLQDAVNKRMINADEKLKVLFGKAKADMFELTKFVSKHLK
jgi:chromatin remodeling complex protein RSC6